MLVMAAPAEARADAEKLTGTNVRGAGQPAKELAAAAADSFAVLQAEKLTASRHQREAISRGRGQLLVPLYQQPIHRDRGEFFTASPANIRPPPRHKLNLLSTFFIDSRIGRRRDWR